MFAPLEYVFSLGDYPSPYVIYRAPDLQTFPGEWFCLWDRGGVGFLEKGLNQCSTRCLGALSLGLKSVSLGEVIFAV